jgi:hypothetical protein
MASDKRDFSNFHAFPGEIKQSNDTSGWYIFPPVTSLDSKKRERVWTIFVRLIITINGKLPAKRKINWDVKQDVVIPINTLMLDADAVSNGSMSDNTIAQIWTVQGIVGNDGPLEYKSTRSIPTYISKGKNLGKKNATTVLTQALIHARSKYLKKVNNTAMRETVKRVNPMAVHKYSETPRDITKHIVYPVAVQRKLDGGRTVAYFDTDEKKVIMYSRNLKDVTGQIHITCELEKMFKIINEKIPGAYLDGEIYKHGLILEEISGKMRREKGSKTAAKEKAEGNTVQLEFHIFDLFFIDDEACKMSYIERMILLHQMFKLAKPLKLKFIKNVKTYIVDDRKREEELYHQFLKEKYEGSIVRNTQGQYEFGTSREKRTYQARKRKPRYSAEFKLLDYTQGDQGKDRGAIIWVLITAGDSKKNINPKKFNSTPKDMNYPERYAVFKSMTPAKFNRDYKNKMMTIEYDTISKDGVPLRAKSKGIRLLA